MITAPIARIEKLYRKEALDHVQRNHVAFGARARVLVSHLALPLMEAGDTIIIPAPVSQRMFIFKHSMLPLVILSIQLSSPTILCRFYF